jgi:hypothetical protein
LRFVGLINTTAASDFDTFPDFIFESQVNCNNPNEHWQQQLYRSSRIFSPAAAAAAIERRWRLTPPTRNSWRLVLSKPIGLFILFQFGRPLSFLSLFVGGKSIHRFLFGGRSGEELVYFIE